MKCTNAELGAALGLSHSTVSRMRAGTRTGSLQTILKLASVSGVPVEDVANAAIEARDGELEHWHAVLDRACGIEEEKPE